MNLLYSAVWLIVINWFMFNNLGELLNIFLYAFSKTTQFISFFLTMTLFAINFRIKNADKLRTNQQICKNKTLIIKRLSAFLVPGAGIEPAHREILEFESSASTNSANRAF